MNIQIGSLHRCGLPFPVFHDRKTHTAIIELAVVNGDLVLNWRRVVGIRVVTTLDSMHHAYEVHSVSIPSPILVAFRGFYAAFTPDVSM